MNYKHGLEELKRCLELHTPDALSGLAVLADRFQRNQRAESIFGSSENTRNEHAQIIHSLNELTLQHCGVTFNDLCTGQQSAGNMSASDDHAKAM